MTHTDAFTRPGAERDGYGVMKKPAGGGAEHCYNPYRRPADIKWEFPQYALTAATKPSAFANPSAAAALSRLFE